MTDREILIKAWAFARVMASESEDWHWQDMANILAAREHLTTTAIVTFDEAQSLWIARCHDCRWRETNANKNDALKSQRQHNDERHAEVGPPRPDSPNDLGTYAQFVSELETAASPLVSCSCGKTLVMPNQLTAVGDGMTHSLTRCRTYLREIRTVDASTLDLLHYARENDKLRETILEARQRILSHRFTATDQACARSLLEILSREEQ